MHTFKLSATHTKTKKTSKNAASCALYAVVMLLLSMDPRTMENAFFHNFVVCRPIPEKLSELKYGAQMCACI